MTQSKNDSKEVMCRDCSGEGYYEGAPPLTKCKTCKGTGKVPPENDPYEGKILIHKVCGNPCGLRHCDPEIPRVCCEQCPELTRDLPTSFGGRAADTNEQQHVWLVYDERATMGDTDDAIVLVACSSLQEAYSYTEIDFPAGQIFRYDLDTAARNERHIPTPICSICRHAWNDKSNTNHCTTQHGLCSICQLPRTAGTCKCLTTEV